MHHENKSLSTTYDKMDMMISHYRGDQELMDIKNLFGNIGGKGKSTHE